MAAAIAPPIEAPLGRYVRWALAVTAGSMPLYVVRWHIGPLPIINYIQNLNSLDNLICAPDVIGVCMCSNKIVDLLDVITLQSFEDDLAFACVTSINQDGLAVRRDEKNRITINRPDIENVNLKFFTRRRRRLRLPPRVYVFPSNIGDCNKANYLNGNPTSAALLS